MDVLCEVHTSEELRRALDLGFRTIGVNSRNLHSFAVAPETLHALAAEIPDGCLCVAESGIRSAAAIAQLRTAGYHAFLIGESLMREPDPGATLAALLRELETPVARS